MALSLLPATALAVEETEPVSTTQSTEQNGLSLTKRLSGPGQDGNYTVTLEAYATGEESQVTVSKPLDIALVLDTSGSMEEDIVVGSGTSGLSALNSTYGGNQGTYQMKISDKLGVTRKYDLRYENGQWEYDKIFGGWTPLIGSGYENNAKNIYVKKLDALKIAVYEFIDSVQQKSSNSRIAVVSFANDASTLIDLTPVDDSGVKSLKGKVSKLKADGATAADKGIQTAASIFAQSGTAAGRQKVVVMFTDGEPTTTNSFDNNVANGAISAAHELKGSAYLAKVFTVGVFDNPSNKVTNYMNYMSSNYPDAESLNTPGSKKNDGYYITASNADALSKAFETITETITSPVNVKLDSNTIVKDVISQYFELAEDGEIKTYTQNKTADGWNERVEATGLQVSPDGQTIQVSGYDFAGHAVTAANGQKLVIEFPVAPQAVKSDNQLIPSNDSAQVLSEEQVVASCASPTVKGYSVVYDVNGGSEDFTPASDGYYLPGVTVVVSGTPTHAAVDGKDVEFAGWSLTKSSDIYDSNTDLPDIVSTVEIPSNDDVTVHAVWKYAASSPEEDKYGVTYEFEYAEDAPTSNRPEGVAAAPTDDALYEVDNKDVPVASVTSPVKDSQNKGTWTFSGWKLNGEKVVGETATMKKGGLTFTGTWTFEAEEITPDWDWKGSTSKTAENLVKGTDGRYTSQVTLSIPSAEEPLATDVVFVLDKSTSAELEQQALEMLSSLQKQAADTSAKINVGVVIFNKIANVANEGKFFDLATQYGEIEAAIEENISSGTNTHAGLLAGKAMLDKDTSVPANRKYLIFVSDGVTYMYNENPTVIAWSFKADVEKHFAGPDNWKSKYGSDEAPENWTDWLSTAGEQIKALDEKYEYSYGTEPRVCTDVNAATTTANSIDKALYLTNKVYQDAKAEGYHCYAMKADSKSGMQYLWGPSFMEYLADGKAVSFGTIKQHILYAVDAGSYVKDYMGYVDGDYNFDFVNDASKLSITVGKGEPYKAVKIDANDDNHYGFGPKLDNGKYSYELTYTPGSKEADEYFVWDINVPVSNFAPVALTYTVELSNPKTAAGTYGTYDRNGDGKDDNGNTLNPAPTGLYTNNSAMLYPVDSNGFPSGDPQEFPKPTVSYTVEGESAEKVSYTVKADYYTDGKKDNAGAISLESGEADVGTTITVTPQSAWRTYDGNRYTLTTKNRTLTIGEGPNVLTLRYDRTTSDDDGYDDDDGYLNTEDHFSYIIGYTDGTLRPYGNISRGEVATIFFRLLTDNAREKFWSQTNSYTDVAPEKWCNNAISTLSNMGIIDGYLDGTFRPDGSITRAEFSKMAVNFFDYTVKEYQGYFPDVPEDAWYARYVEAAREMKLIEGYIDGSFQPNKAITRAEACTIVNRTLGRLPDKDQMDVKGIITWPDCSRSDWYYEAMMEATNSHDYSWIYRKNVKSESWSKKLDQRDWAALERTWSTAHSAPGGEVAK